MIGRGPESREIFERSHYEAHINLEMIQKLPGIPEEMKEWLARLPESLQFNEPTILIVGENGSGKTSLARAIMDARGRALQALHPESTNIHGLVMDDEEPAKALSQAISINETRSDPTFNATFIEGAEVMSEVRRWAKSEQQTYRGHRVETGSDGAYTHQLSSRQLFDQAIEEIKHNTIDRHRRLFNRADVIYDEPEQGLSPQRQLALPESITRFIEDGDTMLVPTNNLALFLSDLPRLDLSHPERGVHRPSEYGELGEIRFQGKKPDQAQQLEG